MTTDTLLQGAERIDGARAIELLEAVVAEYGADYVYRDDMCVYWDDGARCLIGKALAAAGYSDEFLQSLDALNLSRDPSGPKAMAQHLDGLTGALVTPVAAAVFSRAQTGQDCGKTWGEALAAARLEFAKHSAH